MQTYEINLWKEKKIIEKIVKEFESDDAVLQYIRDNYDREDELPRLDQEKGFLRPKQSQRYQHTLERRVLRDWFLMIVKRN